MDKAKEFPLQEEYKNKFKLKKSPFFNFLSNRKVRKIISPIVIIILWEIISRSGQVAPYILPAPTIIVRTLIKLLVSQELLPHIYISLMRSLIGFALGSILGIILGIGIGWSKLVEDIVDVPIQVFRAVPKSAVIPLIIIWLGLGEASKIFLVATPSFFMTLINSITGVKSVDNLMVKAARSLGARDRQILKEVVIPTALPMIFAALRLGIVVSLVLLIIAEMIAANYGLGYFILDSQRLWDTPKVFAGIAMITLFGYTFDRIILSMERKFLAWNRSKSF